MTILAGLLDAELARPSHGRSVATKIDQAHMARELERSWKKDEILEAYVNLVGFRGELTGIGAMSGTLFKKCPSGLDAEESAIAAALIRAPNAKPAQVAQRACTMLDAGAAAPLQWPMWPGAHRLELIDATGRVMDAASFEVRGARLKPGQPSRAGSPGDSTSQNASMRFHFGTGGADPASGT